MLQIRPYQKRKKPLVDPAPSRFTYRMNRFWLRRSFRFFVLKGLPTVFSLILIGIIVQNTNLKNLVANKIETTISTLALRPAFQIVGVNIISNNSDIISKVTAIVGFNFPKSSLEINVNDLRSLIEKLDSVKFAAVRLKSDGLIEIEIIERKPVAIQRVSGHFLLLDKDGIKVDEVFSRNDRADLPLLVGKGAEKAVIEAFNIMISSDTLITRIRGLVRIGERRWDLVLDRDQVIKLPEANPLYALKKVVLINKTKNIFSRDFSYLDLRNVERPILGLNYKYNSDFLNLLEWVGQKSL